MIDRDMIDHLEANGFRVVESSRIVKFGAQRSEDLRTFHFIHDGDALMRAIRSRVGADLGMEIMNKAGWTVTDEEGRRVFRTQAEVIL